MVFILLKVFRIHNKKNNNMWTECFAKNRLISHVLPMKTPGLCLANKLKPHSDLSTYVSNKQGQGKKTLKISTLYMKTINEYYLIVYMNARWRDEKRAGINIIQLHAHRRTYLVVCTAGM